MTKLQKMINELSEEERCKLAAWTLAGVDPTKTNIEKFLNGLADEDINVFDELSNRISDFDPDEFDSTLEDDEDEVDLDEEIDLEKDE